MSDSIRYWVVVKLLKLAYRAIRKFPLETRMGYLADAEGDAGRHSITECFKDSVLAIDDDDLSLTVDDDWEQVTEDDDVFMEDMLRPFYERHPVDVKDDTEDDSVVITIEDDEDDEGYW